MQNQPVPTAPPTPPPAQPQGPQPKRRHGCLTTWLIIIILANIISAIVVASVASSVSSNIPGWLIPAEIVFGVWAVVCAIALFMWKKWGFWGFFVGAVAGMIANIASGDYVYAVTPFISVAILYGVLNIGKDNKGWPQLE